jgi:DNA replication protein DnaC
MTLEAGTQSARAALLSNYLRQLKLPTIAKSYAQLSREAREAGKSHEEFLLALLEAEIGQREVSRQKLRLANARFPVLKTLESFLCLIMWYGPL